MQRFKPSPDRLLSGMEPSSAGEYVKYKDAVFEIERLRAALSGMLEHVSKEQFCYCEYKDHTEPADEGYAVDAARFALSLKDGD